jgi:hypothetical protein
MKIPFHISEKLLQLLQGETIPASSAKHAVIEELIEEKVIKRTGRIQKRLSASNLKSLQIFLQNKYGIGDLQEYINIQKKTEITRSELIAVSSDSKSKKVRTFKGFLVNCYSPIEARLRNEQITINPVSGTFHFIYDFEQISISEDITIVGVENPENFRHIEKQKHLFSNLKPLFVSRYPQNQSKDLLKWLCSIPNKYLHFGDFDFAGIGIYLNEYKKHLAARSTFFIPDDIEELIIEYGNKALYNKQQINFNPQSIEETNLSNLLHLITKYKKGLEQEILINHTSFYH